MKTSELESAFLEMEYWVGLNSFGKETKASIPAQLECDPVADLDADALEERIKSKGLSMHVESDRERSLELEIYGREYKRISVTMWPRRIRIYPGENEPTLGELAQITSAIEQSMGCSLSHDPIDDD